MSRTRSRYVTPGHFYDYMTSAGSGRNNQSLFGRSYDSSGWLFTADQARFAMREDMVDNLSTPGSYRDVNAVSHIKKLYANMINGGCTYSYTGSGYPNTYITYIPSHMGCYYTPGMTGFPTPPWPLLVTELADKIETGIETSSLLFVTLAEIRKTYSMVRNPFNLLKADWRNSAHNFSARQLSKAGANIWLEGLYGWKACYRDIKGFSKSYRDVLAYSRRNSMGFEHFSVSQTDELAPVSPVIYGCTLSEWNSTIGSLPLTGNPIWSSGGYFRADVHHRHATYRIGCERLLDTQYRFNRTQAALRALGADFNSILPTLWELVPFSFVIDWFIDTRGLWALPSLARLQRADVRRLCYSTKIEHQSNLTVIHGHPFSGWSVTYGRSPSSRSGTPVLSGVCTGTTYTRAQGGPSIADVRAGLLSANLSSTQLLSGLSLIIQRAIN